MQNKKKKVQFGFAPIVILAVLAVLAVTVGGTLIWQKKGVKEIIGPTVFGPFSPVVFEGDLRNLPTPTPTPSGPYPPVSSAEIKVTVSKNVYSKGEKIKVTITNLGKGTIATTNYQFACSIVALERRLTNGWESLKETCGSAMAVQAVIIEAGEEKEVLLPTVSAGGALPQDLTSGIYRVKFSYVFGRLAIGVGAPPKDRMVVYSSEFQLQ